MLISSCVYMFRFLSTYIVTVLCSILILSCFQDKAIGEVYKRTLTLSRPFQYKNACFYRYKSMVLHL